MLPWYIWNFGSLETDAERWVPKICFSSSLLPHPGSTPINFTIREVSGCKKKNVWRNFWYRCCSTIQMLKCKMSEYAPSAEASKLWEGGQRDVEAVDIIFILQWEMVENGSCFEAIYTVATEGSTSLWQVWLMKTKEQSYDGILLFQLHSPNCSKVAVVQLSGIAHPSGSFYGPHTSPAPTAHHHY